ncbi:hypothetical protein I6F36_06435 [Bradyrhizobium sp. BRP19]|uniref:hypothetical protein n=1 Tax=Bradyrhizobium sp. BRP19 TaxID=2793823 RepID=UPI001CD55D26|nr:hypothetical protein [Bradyrhizobium sp. BRP19]MCA1546442.1 hypothetical protein [Bradyrhizobium sp. BRP19]
MSNEMADFEKRFREMTREQQQRVAAISNKVVAEHDNSDWRRSIAEMTDAELDREWSKYGK